MFPNISVRIFSIPFSFHFHTVLWADKLFTILLKAQQNMVNVFCLQWTVLYPKAVSYALYSY